MAQQERNMINTHGTQLVSFTRKKTLEIAACLLCCLPAAAYSNAHCFCKLGPPGSPIKDFGQIKAYATQIGHDSDCSSACIDAADTYMNDAGNRVSACNKAHGTSIVTYSAVGTKSYQGGKTYTCPQTTTSPAAGSIKFVPAYQYVRTLEVNGKTVNLYALPGSNVTVPINGPFTTFKLIDYLTGHVQAWTYEASLYRDNAVVEKLSGKSSVASSQNVSVDFTGQPNSSVHGHTWKVEWHYFGNNFSNGSVTFLIP
jgi:hypothetical protein